MRSLFYSYQWNWLTDPSPFKIGLWARQTGKDYTCAAEAVMDCAVTPHNHWLIIACGERQAIESLQHAKSWAERLCHSQIKYHKSEILFRNGSRITALPAKPETIRGYSANLILTEFAFHDHPDEIWRAVFPILTNPLKAGPRKLRIISTPNGHNNKFAQLWTSTPIPGSLLIPAPSQAAPPIPSLHINPKSPARCQPANQQSETINQKSTPAFLPSQSENQKSEIINHKSSATVFSRHYVTIHHAVAAGLPINIPLLQRGLADNEAFAQEYECQFLDQSTVLLPYDLIATCESDLATETSTPALLSTCPGEKFLGIDFGRKHDLTVAWFLEKIALHPDPHPSIPPSILKTQSHLFLTREVLILRNASTPQQIEALTPRINLARRVCLDYTGPGIGLGDLLVRQFGECKSGGAPLPSSQSGLAGKVELCTFTQSLKNELFTHLRSAFERRLLAIPPSTISTDIREDLHSIYRIISNNGQVSYRAFHSPDGHSDRCTALALALRAAESAPTVACASTVGTKFRSPGRPRRFV